MIQGRRDIPSAPAADVSARAVGDTDLMVRIAQDDESALRVLYERDAPLVYGLALRILHDQGRAEEVLQETFVRVWRAAIAFDSSRGSAQAWLITITRNLALSELRRLQAHPVLGIEDDVLCEDASSDPEALAWHNSQRALVRDAIAQLPTQQQQVVLLSYYQGLTHAEIAGRTGEPLGTVKSRLRLALRHLEPRLRSSLGEAFAEA